MLRFLSRRWAAFCASFPKDEILAKGSPDALVMVLLFGGAILAVPAYVEPLAHLSRFQHSWVALVLLCLAFLASLSFWRIRGEGSVGAALTLLDSVLYDAVIVLAAVSTAPPVSYAYAGAFFVIFALTHARDFSLTLVFAVATALPSLGLLFLAKDTVTPVIVCVGFATGLLVSHATAKRRHREAHGRAPAHGWRAQWRTYQESLDVWRRNPVFAVSPLGAVTTLLAIALLVLATPLGEIMGARLYGLPTALLLLGLLLELVSMRLRPGPAAWYSLAADAVYVTCGGLGSALLVEPYCHAAGVVFGFTFVLQRARIHTFSAPFVLSVALPTAAVCALPSVDGPLAIILAVDAFCAIWASHVTGKQRALNAQNEGLRVALRASDSLVNDSMDIALTHALLGLGDFLHELRNAQTSVSLGLKFMATGDPSSEDFKDALEDAIRGHQKARELTERTIDGLRGKQHGHTKFWLDDVLREAARDDRNGFRLRCECEQFLVDGDPTQLRMVLANLARNARQAGAKLVEVHCKVAIEARAVLLTVADDGPGLPPEIVPHLFEPFASARKSSGTGLGLYLSRRAIELMGGSIEAKNAPQGGAVFSIRLPGRLTMRVTKEASA
jgi:signal transduction histidine kinase